MTPPISKASRDRPLAPVSERYLQNAAYAYLGRYASSAANLVAVLERKTRRRNEGFAPPDAAQSEMIARVVEKCLTLGLVDDKTYARARAVSLHGAGKSLRAIEAYLRGKGIEPEDIRLALAHLGEERGTNLDWQAAVAFAKRRRFGPFRTVLRDDRRRQKELAALARAGFGYGLATRIIDAENLEDLEIE